MNIYNINTKKCIILIINVYNINTKHNITSDFFLKDIYCQCDLHLKH